MNSFVRKFTALFLLAVFVFYNIQMTKACGPFSQYAAFSYEKHPDLPFENYARGELGILRPGFARSYLFVAYRYLNSTGLNQQEQTAVVNLWNERLGVSGGNESVGGVATWLSARKKVSGVPDSKEISTEREAKKDSYDYYSNCLPDAFNKAAQTLEERITKFGAGSQEAKDFVTAQDRVFSNCSEGQNIPEDAPSNAAAIIKADRAYQIAAAYFYSSNFDEAKTRFERISADSSSPHNGAAALLVARSLIRKASLSEDKSIKSAILTQAQSQLNKVLSNRNYSAYHNSARKLLSLVNLRLNPEQQVHQLAQTLSKRDANPNMKQDLWDYTTLLDKVEFAENDLAESDTKISYSEATKEDLTDWIFTFESGEKGVSHAIEKWEKTQSAAWLVAAIANTKGDNLKVSSLIQAADRISNSPQSYYHINFHIARLQFESGQKDEARRRIDTKILGRTNTSGVSLSNHPSSLNQILNLRMLLATSLDEFLKFSVRKPATYIWDFDGNEMPDNEESDESVKDKNQLLFDFDATNIFNQHFPLVTLREAAENKQLPDNLRKRLAIAVFTKAVVIDREDIGKAIAPTLSQLEPSLKPLLDKYLSASTAADRKAAGLYLILKTPAMRPFVDSGIGRRTELSEIDSYRDNWWCGEAPKIVEYDSNGEAAEKKQTVNLDFLTALQKESAKNEIAKLVALGTAPNYLSQEAVVWGQRSPQNPLVPEALHLAVKSTRYGCTDENTGKYSKTAFDFLHKRYPTSSWAKQTPYWFKGTE